MARDAAAWAERRKELEGDISATHPRYRRRAIATENKLTTMESRWAEFSNMMFGGLNPKETIRNANVVDFKIFWVWHLEKSNIGALSTLETSWKYLRLYYTCKLGESIAKNISTEITAELKRDYKPKGVINHHDVGHLLRSHWECDSWRLRNSRRRVELALIVLLLSFTAGRPG
ncbi:hypothetical protein EV426DRAFT_642352, partial [Tirmania nivea]